MGFLNWVESKLIGELEFDYGPLSTDAQGLGVTASLRKNPSGKRYLVLQWGGRGQLRVVDIEVTPAFLDRMGTMIADLSKRIGSA